MKKQYSNEEIKAFLLEHPELLNSKYRQTAELFNTSFPRIEHICRNIRKKGIGFLPPSTNVIGNTPTSFIKKENIDKGTLETELTTTTEAKSIEELIALHKIDTKLYKVASYWTKQIHNGFRSSLLCSKIKEDSEEKILDNFTNFLENYNPKGLKVYVSDKYITDNKEIVDVEFSLLDAHIDKLSIDNKSLEENTSNYNLVLSNLIKKVSNSFEIRKAVLVIGEDFLHTDTIQNTTTNGTGLEVNSTWDKAYEKGFDTLVKAIIELNLYCDNLEIILVQGNHARTKEFYLAHALEVYFKDSEKEISFNRTSDNTKSIVLGNTFIGYHHGNTKIDSLPLLFATKECFSADFGNSKFREIHVGDRHHYLAKEIKGVRIQQSPALCGDDTWHVDNNFINNIRAGLALVYHPIKGKCAEFEERI